MAGRTSSLVHPKYKTKYSVKNWSEYEQGLRGRGDVMIWFSEEAVADRIPRGKRSQGAQRLYSDLAIETSLTLRDRIRLSRRRAQIRTGLRTRFDASNASSTTNPQPESSLWLFGCWASRAQVGDVGGCVATCYGAGCLRRTGRGSGRASAFRGVRSAFCSLFLR